MAFANASSFNLTGTNYFSFNFSLTGGPGSSPGGDLALGPYNFGDPITATLTFNNKTLATMGLVNAASYVYTVGSGLNTDTVTFNFGAGGGAAVPEPSSLAVVSIAAAAAAIRARRKAKAKA